MAGQLIKSGGRSFHSLAVLGKNECLCASILEYGMENRFHGFIFGSVESDTGVDPGFLDS